MAETDLNDEGLAFSELKEAADYLKKRGYILSPKWNVVRPLFHTYTPDEEKALTCLIHEWDYGNVVCFSDFAAIHSDKTAVDRVVMLKEITSRMAILYPGSHNDLERKRTAMQMLDAEMLRLSVSRYGDRPFVPDNREDMQADVEWLWTIGHARWIAYAWKDAKEYLFGLAPF